MRYRTQFETYAREIALKHKNAKENNLLQGPYGFTVWSRPDKVVIIVGEEHADKRRECKTKANQESKQMLTFLNWFESNFLVSQSKDLSANELNYGWDVFLELRRSMLPLYEFEPYSPMLYLMNYAWKHGCFHHIEKPKEKKICPGKLRFHYVDMRPPILIETLKDINEWKDTFFSNPKTDPHKLNT